MTSEEVYHLFKELNLSIELRYDIVAQTVIGDGYSWWETGLTSLNDLRDRIQVNLNSHPQYTHIILPTADEMQKQLDRGMLIYYTHPQ